MKFLYGLAFSVVNLAEAVVILLSLGLYNPLWCMSFARWYAMRCIERSGK